MPLDRKQEQKLWEAFRQPIDDAFARKSSERERASAALNEHDQRVLDASKALDAATARDDAHGIRVAMEALDAALRGQASARVAEPAQPAPAEPSAAVETPAAEVAADAVPEAGADASGEAPETAPKAAPVAAPVPAKKVVAVRGDDRPGMKKAELASRDDRRAGGRDGRDGRNGPGAGRGPGRGAPEGGGRWGDRAEREPRGPMGPRLGDAAFRAQRNAVEHAEAALRKLAAQAHGEVLTQVLKAWEDRDAAELPTAQALGGRVNAAVRGSWSQSLSGNAAALPGDTLLRLEMAAEVPTPAEHLSARRMLQLQLLTRRNEAAPADTWAQDVAKVLAGGYEAASAKRLQAVLKVLLKR